MGDLDSRIDKAFRSARRKQFVADARGFFWPLMLMLPLFVGVFVFVCVLVGSPRHYEKTVLGYTQSFSPSAGNPRGGPPSPTTVRVALLEGQVIEVAFPPAETYRDNTLVNINVYRRDWPKGSVMYGFKGYADGEVAPQ